LISFFGGNEEELLTESETDEAEEEIVKNDKKKRKSIVNINDNKENISKQVKKVKDKNAPKGILNAYNFFCNEHRQVIKDEHPDFSFSDISTELGTRWKLISEQDKVSFQKQSDEDKIRYKTEMNAYKPKALSEIHNNNNNNNEMISSGEVIKKTKKVKDKNAPRGGLTAYNFFCATQRQAIKDEHPDYSFTDNATELSIRWKALSEEDKIPFQKQADGDKIRYKTEMNAYKAILLADGEDINLRNSNM
jgi:hypothetical protein